VENYKIDLTMAYQIYHNPRCRKSRETLELLKSNKIDPEIILYLEDVPTQKALREILKNLDIPAEQLVRKSESIYKEKFKGKKLTEKEWIKAMVTYPKLIERPIVIKSKKAVLGRPPENVLALIN
jgi:arsenate reductase